MDELVTFRESQFINFRDYEFDGGAHHLYRWMVIKTYDLASAISDDKAVIAGVIGSVEYRDDYVGGGVDPDGDVHGPYWLTSISPTVTFFETDRPSAAFWTSGSAWEVSSHPDFVR